LANTERLPSGLPAQVADAELLARFVFSDSHVNRSGIVKKGAFMPAPEQSALSVTRVDGLLAEDMEHYATQARGTRPSEAKGYAALKAGNVRAEGFQVVADEPPPRHAHIQHFPQGKDDQIEKAQALALRVERYVGV
jgi:hypothetical protein